MSNEDKILAILEQMSGRLGNIETDVAGLKTDVSDLKQGQAKLETGQTKLEESVDRLHGSVAVIENDHGKSLGALHSEFKYVREDLDYLKPFIETTAAKVSILEASISIHADKIDALSAAG